MKFIEPLVELKKQSGTWEQHIADCARICYKSEQPSDDQGKAVNFCGSLWHKGHRSMFRHGTVYFFVPDFRELPEWIFGVLINSPYIFYCRPNHGSTLFISTNIQYWQENIEVARVLSPFEVTMEEYIKQADGTIPVLMGLRLTMVVTTQISTSRELNRTSPNNIAEQSTRYVNFGKRGGIAICKPHWYDGAKRWVRMVYKAHCKISEWAYTLLLRAGFKPEDARGVLPLDTATKVAYTYTLEEWNHILMLRLYETTGKAHPNAKLVASEIKTHIDSFISECRGAIN